MIRKIWRKTSRFLTTPIPGTPPGRHLILAANIFVLIYLCVGCNVAPVFFR